jgi:hypothetical protein
MHWGFSQAEKKTAEDKSVQRLVRMDLLNFPKGETSPPKRNIFAPASSSARPPVAAVPTAGLPEAPFQSEQGGTPVSQEQPPATLTVNLRYVGFVVSSDRFVALIILEGQAVAVVEGEVVAEGLRIGKITSEEIEIVLPDSSVRKYSLEGEG